MACFLHEVALQFLLKTDDSVPSRRFSNVTIKECNAKGKSRFSNAYVKYDSGFGVPLFLFWQDSICKLMERKIIKDENIRDDKIFEDLINFLEDENNRKHLMKVTSAGSESELQSILAHHLFAPLASSSKYLVDESKAYSEQCPACKKKLNLGDTSFGHADYWHGLTDILIGRSTVKVGKDLEDEESVDGSMGEPSHKYMRRNNGQKFGSSRDTVDSDGDSDCSSVSVHLNEQRDHLPQIFSQTITNAFFESSKCSQMSDLFIPSFFATPDVVSIHMYNCETDRLYTSENMKIWSGDNYNIGTIVCIWLALHFERFQNKVPEEEFTMRNVPKANFKTFVGDLLPIYEKNLTKPLKNSKERNSSDINFDMKFLLIVSEYSKQMSEKLQRIQTMYEKKLQESDDSKEIPF
ncbi:uncharacterized protein LOC127737967 [Mytilus californianus]|uniref:uncharacterized protein LOC127737967 n=1 Tax=Mytilus californianus TaxID=6549 RepID=UPI002247493F|nr:uncharacterized protein LOC127737967 [Mytilus californianus]